MRRVMASSLRALLALATEDAPEGEVMERLVDRGRDRRMDRAEERSARERTFEDGVQQADQSGLSAAGATRSRECWAGYVDAFRLRSVMIRRCVSWLRGER